MAGLDNIDPQGELVRRITALEAEQRRIGSLRRRPAVNLFAAKDGNQVVSATTYTKVTDWSIYYTNPEDSWDDANSEYTAQAPGMYLVVANLVWTGSTANQKTLVYFSESPTGYLAGSGWTSLGEDDVVTPLVCVTQLDAGVPYYLSVFRFVAGGTIAGTASTLQVHRLSDVPANI